MNAFGVMPAVLIPVYPRNVFHAIWPTIIRLQIRVMLVQDSRKNVRLVTTLPPGKVLRSIMTANTSPFTVEPIKENGMPARTVIPMLPTMAHLRA